MSKWRIHRTLIKQTSENASSTELPQFPNVMLYLLVCKRKGEIICLLSSDKNKSKIDNL